MTAAQTQETTLWELAGADPNCVFSPFVWRVRLALYYKGQSYKSVPWRYTEKDLIKPSEKVTSRSYHLLFLSYVFAGTSSLPR